jgi:hypothetical protein
MTESQAKKKEQNVKARRDAVPRVMRRRRSRRGILTMVARGDLPQLLLAPRDAGRAQVSKKK